jgi:hypothetical protein
VVVLATPLRLRFVSLVLYFARRQTNGQGCTLRRVGLVTNNATRTDSSQLLVAGPPKIHGDLEPSCCLVCSPRTLTRIWSPQHPDVQHGLARLGDEDVPNPRVRSKFGLWQGRKAFREINPHKALDILGLESHMHYCSFLIFVGYMLAASFVLKPHWSFEKLV